MNEIEDRYVELLSEYDEVDELIKIAGWTKHNVRIEIINCNLWR